MMKIALKIGILGITIATLSSCYQTFGSDDSHSPTSSPLPSIRSSNIKSIGIQSHSEPSYVSVEDWMKHRLSQLRNSKEEYVNSEENRSIMEKLLKKDPKFRRIAATCNPTKLTQIDKPFNVFPLQHPIEPGIYLIVLQCTSGGRSANSYRLFTYTDSQGINPKPLKLTVVSIKEMRVIKNGLPTFQYTGELKFEDTINLVSKGLGYDPKKKELLLASGCNRADGRIYSLTKYHYKHGKFILSEFWHDDLSNTQCIKENKLRKLYSS
ncbi:hypothetical protein [Pantanalinema sp. GBBB05]|uniref:hypothetical protein n=1 Tax=Pantanalinema sp. GBBB05 TaxID=2604139 RepID=UPI001D5C598E|nr:hypothetical protein [Pantanalinema sp. GBBB05]